MAGIEHNQYVIEDLWRTKCVNIFSIETCYKSDNFSVLCKVKALFCVASKYTCKQGNVYVVS
jgi:hypothetical protein